MSIGLELEKRVFIWGVLAIVVIPRQHIDRTYFSVGGDWSSAFRKLLVVAVVLNFIRLMASIPPSTNIMMVVSDILGCIEVVWLGFLCFYTPYILRRSLIEWGYKVGRKIIQDGNADTPLYAPLAVTGLLSVLGVCLSRSVHPNFWALKKVANVVSAPLILRTLSEFNSETTKGGFHEGRGYIMSQTIMVLECWHFVTQLLSAFGYAALNQDSSTVLLGESSNMDQVLKAFRDVAFVSDWTRVCGHGIFINYLDELYLSTPADPSPAPGTTNSDISVEEVKVALVSPVSAPGAMIRRK